jgi:arylsulfatase A-like enzyme
MTSSLDITATILAAAGVTIDNTLDGVDLLPFLTGKNMGSPHETLYWRMGASAAVRHGNYKLFRRGQETMLFDLSNDIHEDNNLAASHPQMSAHLLSMLVSWSSEMAQPLWTPKSQGGKN